MEYKLLSKFYYKDKKEYEAEHQLRKHSMFGVSLPILISGESAFYCSCPQINTLLSRINKAHYGLCTQARHLPTVAYESYARSCLVDEVMLTNDIEGVRSTRKEITDILNISENDGEKALRFQGLVRKYVRLLEQNDFLVPLANSQDIRTLYDEIVLPEIAQEDIPDGTLFRKSSVSVVSATQKEKHVGVLPPEENIKLAVDQTLQLLHRDDIPELIQIGLIHYFFGYIHPFYDGNGRLSRFISSYLLQQHLHPLVSLRLSYSIKNNKKRYYDAFDVVNDRRNLGDTTPFVLMFLQVVLESIESLEEKITTGNQKLAYYWAQLETLELAYGLSKEQCTLIFVLIQNKLFGTDPFHKQELQEVLQVSSATLNRRLSAIDASPLGDCILQSKRGRKHLYEIDLDKFDTLAQQITQD